MFIDLQIHLSLSDCGKACGEKISPIGLSDLTGVLDELL
jgi:hypothetical protein